MNTVRFIPDGYHTVTPYMIVNQAANALVFYKMAFNAVEKYRLTGPNGEIQHAEIQIGDSRIMLADEFPSMDARGALTYGGSPVSLMLYVDDVDSLFAQATKAGATVIRPVANQFYGDRSGVLKDPFGHTWTLATHVEDVSEAEMKQRLEQMQKDQHA